MRRRPILLELPVLLSLATITLTMAVHGLSFVPTPTPYVPIHPELDPRTPEEAARGNINLYCGSCHNSGRSGIDFNDETLVLSSMRRDRSAWEEVVRRVRSHEMPPRRFPQPTEAQRNEIIEWLEKEVLQAPIEPPARFWTRRLQRNEYINTMRDLLGVQPELPEDFPKDEPAWSPSTDIRDVVPTDLEKYRAAAEKLLACISFTDMQRNFVTCGLPCDMSKPRDLLSILLRRAHRRPVDSEELERLMTTFSQAQANGKATDECIKAALIDLLTSPQFLQRIEIKNEADRVDQIALASRLSYFLWRSMPDEELIGLAEQGMLEEKLESQVTRLLLDPRSRAFATDFAGFWLTLDKLGPSDASDLRGDMRRETEMFVTALLREGRGIRDVIDADFTFVNERLAKHYGISTVIGDEMRRVDLKGGARGGLLAHAGILTLNSSDGETKPVNRGKWVLENLLGAPPVRPPAGLLDAFENAPKNIGAGSTRRLVERHRANPSCAECHWKMDAIGLTLEHFGPQGAWRDASDKVPVEAIGLLPNGETLNGLPDLKQYLLQHREKLVQALGSKLLQFGVGRKLMESEKTALERLPELTAPHQDSLARIILEVVRSEPFRRGFSEVE